MERNGVFQVYEVATLDISQCKINIFQALLKSFMLSLANSLWYDSDGGL